MTSKPYIVAHDFMNRFKTVLLWIVLSLMTLLPVNANAFPVFCSDMTTIPDRELTGCQLEAFTSKPQDSFFPPVTAAGRISGEIDEMLSRTPKNRHLFYVGPDVIIDDQDGQVEGDSPAGEAEKQAGLTPDEDLEAADGISESMHRDENWYYMNIDQDGTHIFFGDVPEVGEPTTSGDDDDILPDGIGIGKKWQF